MKSKEEAKTIREAKELTDEELETAAAGMKIVVEEESSWLQSLLRLIFKIKS